MTLSSALQDIQQTTLSAVEGLLRKLEYLARLQDRHGEYSHWGMARTYGQSAAHQDLAQAHRSVLSRVLTTPISYLLEDVEKSSEIIGFGPEAYVRSLASREGPMLPPEPGAGSERHLKSVLQAISSLLRVRNQDGRLPSSSPSQPLDR